MAISITRGASRGPHLAADLAAVRVQLTLPGGRRRSLGTAREALATAGLTSSERAAIEALVRAVALLRRRSGLVGIDDAGTAVRLILREPDATRGGPWATVGELAVGTRSGLAARARGRAREDVLLTVDTAVHELVHVVQFGRMPHVAKPHAAILEGIADTVAMLATDDATLGEEFFRRDADGRHRGSIRELAGRTTSGAAIGGVVGTYAEAISPGRQEHAAGGVVSAAFVQLRGTLGRERAEQLIWAVIRDTHTWRTGGSWRELVLGMRRAAARTWPGDGAARDAIESALRTTGLDAAAR